MHLPFTLGTQFADQNFQSCTSRRSRRTGSTVFLFLLLVWIVQCRAIAQPLVPGNSYGLAFETIDYPGSNQTYVFGFNLGRTVLVYNNSDGRNYLKNGSVFDPIIYPAGFGFASANGINDSTQVVGQYLSNGLTHGFLKTGATFTSIDYPGALSTSAQSVNNNGQILGNFTDSQGAHGFVKDGAAFSSFDYPSAVGNSFAAAINDKGQIVGSYSLGLVGPHGFLKDGSAFQSFDYPWAVSTNPRAINNNGQIAGNYIDASGRRHGFVKEGSTCLSIDIPGASETDVNAINNGQIAGSYFVGTFPSAAVHGFVATIIPGAYAQYAVPCASSGSLRPGDLSGLSITDYELVSQQQVTPTQRSLTYHASLLNTGGPLASVTATVISLNPFSVRVVPGQDTLTFFSVPANSKTASIKTFTVLVNNTQPFDFSSLSWTFQASTASPIANAGPDQIVPVGSTVSLDGTSSTNPSGIGTLTYSWVFTSRPPGSVTRLLGASSPTPTFVTTAPGGYVIKLTVSNGLSSSSASVTVTATPAF